MKKLLIILFSTIMALSCNDLNENNSELEFEKKVFKEIYPELIAELKDDSRRMPPPPPMPYLDENANIIGYDSIGHIETLRKHKQKMAELDRDTSKMVIALGDTIFNLEKSDFENFLRNI